MKSFFKDGVAYTGAGAFRGESTREPDELLIGAESAFPITVSGWATFEGDERSGTKERMNHVAQMIASERALHQAAKARRRQLSLSVIGIVALLGLGVLLQFVLL